MNPMNLLAFIFLTLSACSVKSGPENSNAGFGTLVSADADSKKEVVCFVYHRFGDSKYPSTNVSVADFKAHLQYLKDEGFAVMTLGNAIDYLRSGVEVKKVAVITIDDGYESFYENGFPLLKQFNFPATLFINTETVGGSTYMDWKQLEDVKKAGIEIGNHTHSHAFFLDMPEERRYQQFEEEIEKSQKIIDENLGVAPNVFAYPYGEFDPQMKNIVEKAGFKAGAAQNSGIIWAGSDVYALPRFPMASAYSAIDKFREKAGMHALRVEKEEPKSFLVPDKSKAPILKITFPAGNLQTGQVQCFVQGGECTKEITIQGDLVSLTVQAKKPLQNRRRTLYTVTVPDKSGKWHWFSHLWINTDIPGE